LPLAKQSLIKKSSNLKLPKTNSTNLGSCIDMDKPCKFTNLNTPIIPLVKRLPVIASFSLVAKAFADAPRELMVTYSSKFRADDFDSALPIYVQVAKQFFSLNKV
jgi:hypothetical protein